MIYGKHLHHLADGLRGRVILRILQEGKFDMQYWTPSQAKTCSGNPCNTACCIAGNIVIEGDNTPNPSMCGVADHARRIWAKHYGQESADLLDFFGAGTDKGRPSSEEAINHLMSI